MESLFLDAVVIWFLIGLVLMVAELVIPGLIILFFGVGAWVVALVLLFIDLNINTQLFIFVASSVFSLVLLRKMIRKRYINLRTASSQDLEDSFTGKIVEAICDFDEQGRGKVFYSGTEWDAVLETPQTFAAKGDKLRVVGFESITLVVTPLK